MFPEHFYSILKESISCPIAVDQIYKYVSFHTPAYVGLTDNFAFVITPAHIDGLFILILIF